jgi:hypothetical protein
MAAMLKVTKVLGVVEVAEGSTKSGGQQVQQVMVEGIAHPCYMVLINPAYVDPNRVKGSVKQGKSGPYTVDRTGGARLNNGGAGRFRSGASVGPISILLDVQHNDRLATAKTPKAVTVEESF